MKSIQVFGCANGVGISRDMGLIQEVLTGAGYDVVLSHTFKSTPTRKYDLNIFLERFHPPQFNSAKKNVLIPNQEWFEPGWIPALKAFDKIFTKTKFADDVFKKLGQQTEFISFTSEDRYEANYQKDPFHWLHIVGKSVQKQTEIVVKTWENNPGFPQLTVIHDPKFYKPRYHARNINYCFDRFPEQLLKCWQNVCGVHVCPSETEGFGHYIVEAMSCKATVITTEAAPMTELVQEDMGFFVKPVKQEQMRLSLKNIISEDALAKAVIDCMIAPELLKTQMGEKARLWYLDNDKFFRRRLVEAVATFS